jgi:hypothetical protein
LFNSARDVNPFGTLYESLWMLAGRNDVAPLAYYTKQFLEYSDDGRTLNGAYGDRWRNTATRLEGGIDQLGWLTRHLRDNPNSRRAVLQMWNTRDDLLKIDESKDVCCNLSVAIAVRDGAIDVTVFNRSNDLVWGLLGANYVTFCVLQEYLAARMGARVGRYHHVTNDLHVYDWNWKPEEWLGCEAGEARRQYHADVRTVPLVCDPAVFEAELPQLVEHWSGKLDVHDALADGVGTRWTEPFLRDVADPLFAAFACHKARHYHDAFTILAESEGMADDWRVAAEQWLTRRAKKYERK